MSRFEYEDRLELLGILVGGFIVLYALAILAGTPWATNADTIAVLVQLFGILATAAIGVALILVAYTGDVSELLPGETD